MQDPFADLATNPIKDQAVAVPSGSLFVFDLETIPDESRFPRPQKIERPVRPDHDIDLDKLATKPIHAIKPVIRKLSPIQLEQLGTIEQSSAKPRAGIFEAIEQQVAEDNGSDHAEAMDQWRRLALSPFQCRIVALGIKSAKNQITMIAKNQDEERELLNVFWRHVENFQRRCGYNIHGFDDSVIIARSILLGVTPPVPLSRKRYGDAKSIDLMQVLFPNYGSAQKLKDVCGWLGITPPAGDVDGSMVLDMVDAGDWDKLRDYVTSDAHIEYELYSKIRDYVTF